MSVKIWIYMVNGGVEFGKSAQLTIAKRIVNIANDK